jgi:glycosyltransferase involved in cell wall biosynthesis
LIANAWALVFPTLAEGFGFPPLEALACGVPVVCSDIPVMRENLGRAGEAVLWFDAQDPVSLAAVLRELDTRYEAVKAAAMNQRSAFTRRTWQEVAEDYWNVFSLASGIPNTEKVTRRIVGTETPLG